MKFIIVVHAMTQVIIAAIGAAADDPATTLSTSITNSATLYEITGSPYTVWPHGTTGTTTIVNGGGVSIADTEPTPIPSGVPIFCHIGNWRYGASYQYTEYNIGYLRTRTDDPNGGPALCKGKPGPVGKSRCQRVACQHNSGIWVCDDLNSEVAPTCEQVADAAEDITVYCGNGSNMQHIVQGQKFGPVGSGWNIIVAGEDNGC